MPTVAKMYRLSKLAHVPDQIELPNCMYHLDRQYQWEDKDLAEEYYGNTRAPQGQSCGNSKMMYRLERATTVPAYIEPPTCMYHLERYYHWNDQNFAQNYYGSSGIEKDNVSELATRQEAVLKKLQQLKLQVDQLQGSNVPSTGVKGSVVTANAAAAAQAPQMQAGVVHDVVISAKPSAAPYSLVLIKMLLRDAGISVYCASHVHSTVHKVESELSSAFCDVGSGERSQHNLAFTVLWKDTQQPQLMVSPMSQTRVCGEANIVRYLSRLFPATSMYNYEAASSFCCIAETDQLMDQLQAQLADGNKKEKQAALRQLNGKLGGARFLLGDQLSIIDILAWSLVKQMDDGASAPTNVAKWYKSINSLLEPDNKNHQVNEAQKRVHQNDSDSKNSKKQKMSLTPVKKEKSPLKESNAQNSPVPSLPPSSMNKSHMDRTGFQNYLQKNGIKYQVQDHKEVFTVEALMQCVPDMPGLHMKNLFLKDKKKNLYLLSTRHDAKVSLNDVAKKLGTKDLRFGDETVMKDILGVGQGCVTAFALVNDTKHQVVMAIDEEATNGVHQYINFHPMSNAATLGVSPADLQKFFTLTGHKPTLLKFE